MINDLDELTAAVRIWKLARESESCTSHFCLLVESKMMIFKSHEDFWFCRGYEANTAKLINGVERSHLERSAGVKQPAVGFTVEWVTNVAAFHMRIITIPD